MVKSGVRSKLRMRYRFLAIWLIILLSMAAGVFFYATGRHMAQVYDRAAADSLISAKKTFLHDTINNVIIEIERTRENFYQYYKNMLNSTENILVEYYTFDPDNFINISSRLISSAAYRDTFEMLIYENTSGELKYSSDSRFNGETTNEAVARLRDQKQQFISFALQEYEVIIWTCSDSIDQIVQAETARKIHSYEFGNDVYIWVNEVINYNGGEDYAIRRIHPNLKETEGSYLSTSTQDAAGNFPYLEELEGINKDGEIYFTYQFKKLNSDVISEKLSYAKLYEPYDWIIATGIHLDDIDALIADSQKEAEKAAATLLIIVILAAISAILLSWLGFSLLDRWYYSSINRELKHEAYSDSMTKIPNRRAGAAYLADMFRELRKGSQAPAIFLFDLDKFKDVNDTYGHETGDLVLKKFADVIQANIRSSDYFCRWGGEEFLLICHGLKQENALNFVTKLLTQVEGAAFPTAQSDKTIHITFSAGAAYPQTRDISADDALRRADRALFHAKANGRNRACHNTGDENEDIFTCMSSSC
ncbi:MAG: diguanylate cyclase [Eubacteriales bacterium]|nr:diguanylate cyclase [Eubacteriales bacterium]MDD3504604.1 diguanylate cyclase [Eubacteriales bacterium]